MFALNLKPLLMQPPVKGHVTMGLDPGYPHRLQGGGGGRHRQGAGHRGGLPHLRLKRAEAGGHRTAEGADPKSTAWSIIAIGNGTASRETEQMAAELIHDAGRRRQLYGGQRGRGLACTPPPSWRRRSSRSTT